MNMQYARAVLAHEQAYRDRARAAHLIVNHVNISPEQSPIVAHLQRGR
jgi:hypothetical protein